MAFKVAYPCKNAVHPLVGHIKYQVKAPVCEISPSLPKRFSEYCFKLGSCCKDLSVYDEIYYEDDNYGENTENVIFSLLGFGDVYIFPEDICWGGSLFYIDYLIANFQLIKSFFLTTTVKFTVTKVFYIVCVQKFISN